MRLRVFEEPGHVGFVGGVAGGEPGAVGQVAGVGGEVGGEDGADVAVPDLEGVRDAVLGHEGEHSCAVVGRVGVLCGGEAGVEGAVAVVHYEEEFAECVFVLFLGGQFRCVGERVVDGLAGWLVGGRTARLRVVEGLPDSKSLRMLAMMSPARLSSLERRCSMSLLFEVLGTQCSCESVDILGETYGTFASAEGLLYILCMPNVLDRRTSTSCLVLRLSWRTRPSLRSLSSETSCEPCVALFLFFLLLRLFLFGSLLIR